MIIKDRKILASREMPINYGLLGDPYKEEQYYDAIQELCNKHDAKFHHALINIYDKEQVFEEFMGHMGPKYRIVGSLKIPHFVRYWELVVYMEK